MKDKLIEDMIVNFVFSGLSVKDAEYVVDKLADYILARERELNSRNTELQLVLKKVLQETSLTLKAMEKHYQRAQEISE